MPKTPSKIDLDAIATPTLMRELEHRKAVGRRLIVRRQRLGAKLEALDRRLAAMGLSATPRVARAKNSLTLVEALQKLLAGGPLGVPALVEGLPKVGYHSSSPNLRTQVGTALSKRTLFKRVSRGVYAARPKS